MHAYKDLTQVRSLSCIGELCFLLPIKELQKKEVIHIPFQSHMVHIILVILLVSDANFTKI